MGDIKDYRDKELKLYALANIFVIIYIERIITIEELWYMYPIETIYFLFGRTKGERMVNNVIICDL